MKTVRGDIWPVAAAQGAAVVVTTNIGWTRAGHNPMGRGIAKQAAERALDPVAKWYGAFCQRYGAATPVVEYLTRSRPPLENMQLLRLLLFPTKPFNAQHPNLSWRSDATLELIERSTQQLADISGLVCLPLVGCANGGLVEEEVLPILHAHLTSDRFTLVLR